MKFFTKPVIWIIVLAVILSGAVYIWQLSQINRPLTEHEFRVEQTDNTYNIAVKLKNEGIIKNKIYFYLVNFIYNKGTPIIPGVYKLSSDMSTKQIVYALGEEPWKKFVTIPPNMSKEAIGNLIADALGWGELDRQFFAHTYAGMQWRRYSLYVEQAFTAQYGWNKTKSQTFLELSALYYDSTYDFLRDAYIPGTYEIPIKASRAQAAGILIDEFAKQHPADETMAVVDSLDRSSMDSISKLIESEMELMPDIVALPPTDITLKTEGNRTYLLFTTAYWNKGGGPLELVADPKTKGIVGDIDRKVFQRIYKLDGDYRERASGSFLWHQTHRHNHFQDFAIYALEAMDTADNDTAFKDKKSLKSTFCIRDSEPIDLAHPGSNKDSSYNVCGKERQGISQGWADAYYYTYIDQRFDVTNAPEGIYKLSILINPADRFEEITKENNFGEVNIFLNVKDEFVEITEKTKYAQ